jgi:hypothetical protein
MFVFQTQQDSDQQIGVLTIAIHAVLTDAENHISKIFHDTVTVKEREIRSEFYNLSIES